MKNFIKEELDPSIRAGKTLMQLEIDSLQELLNSSYEYIISASSCSRKTIYELKCVILLNLEKMILGRDNKVQ